MKNMVTIKDIARESGYSVSTVSRVLNHRNDVSPDAKKKIEKVVAAYNFVPNNNAKHHTLDFFHDAGKKHILDTFYQHTNGFGITLF